MPRKGETVDELLDQASALLDEQDYHHAVKCLHRAQALAPFRQDIREMLAEAIDWRLAATNAPLDADFSSRDFSKTREKPSPKVIHRKHGRRIGFGIVLIVLCVGLVGAIILAVMLSRMGERSLDDEIWGESTEEITLDETVTVDDLMQEAQTALDDRLYEDALALLEEAMEMAPENPEPVRRMIAQVHATRGRQGFDAGRYGRAEEDYQAAVDLEPDNPEHFYSLGWCHYYLGMERRNAGDEDEAVAQITAAVEAFEASLDLDRASAKTHRSLGQALIQAGDREGAFAAWNTTIRLDPQGDDAARARRFLQSFGMTPPQE